MFPAVLPPIFAERDTSVCLRRMTPVGEIVPMNIHIRFWRLAMALIIIALSACSRKVSAQKLQATDVSSPPSLASGGLYHPNRAPLKPIPFLKLPPGSIVPGGWLRKQLELDAGGIVGQMPKLSDYLKYEGNGWVDPNGKAGWEELTYWLRGYGDLGYVLKDEAIIKEAKHWIDGVLTSQRADGWFGPESARTSLDGGPDLWPHMPMLNALRSYAEYTDDPRVIPFLMRFFKYQDGLPAEVYKRGWGAVRWGDNLDTVYWLYNRTGESWLLGLADKMHRNSADYTDGIPTWHNVNLSQGIREPAEYAQQAGDDKFLKATYRDYDTVMGLYGQFPGGGFAGDENCRPGYGDPRQGFETCGWVEFMHTFEMLTRITGDPLWAGRCEEIAFNSYPAALDPQHKGTHYITSANCIQLDNLGKHEGQFANGDFPMQAYMPGIHNYRCCPHNLGMGWPYYAEELWLATTDNGLCASLYAQNKVTAKVAKGQEVTFTEDTDYPFRNTISLKVSVADPVSFPLYLRVPGWCSDASVQVNGKRIEVKALPGTYIVLNRSWRTGDRVTLTLPMHTAIRTWSHNKNSVSVDYGPLTFSVDIKEKWETIPGPDAWPAFEVKPESPWNYGLVLDSHNPTQGIRVLHKAGPVSDLPFTQATAPITLQIKARRIPEWQADSDNVVGLLQPSPVRSDQPEETITLVPMGGARLRITSFPVIGVGSDAHTWKTEALWPRVSASFVHDSLKAVRQERTPAGSGDETIPRFTWWDHRGTAEWIQYDFEKPRTVSAISVYWFDDTGHGQCRVPQSARLLYKQGDRWVPVPGAPMVGVEKDRANRIAFPALSTTALRLEVQLQPNVSGGVLSWILEPNVTN